MKFSQFCLDHGHTWEITQLFTVPHCRDEIHLRRTCAQCGKTIAGHIELELDGERTLNEILEYFQDISEFCEK